jgi:hypothetical protein
VATTSQQQQALLPALLLLLVLLLVQSLLVLLVLLLITWSWITMNRTTGSQPKGTLCQQQQQQEQGPGVQSGQRLIGFRQQLRKQQQYWPLWKHGCWPMGWVAGRQGRVMGRVRMLGMQQQQQMVWAWIFRCRMMTSWMMTAEQQLLGRPVTQCDVYVYVPMPVTGIAGWRFLQVPVLPMYRSTWGVMACA